MNLIRSAALALIGMLILLSTPLGGAQAAQVDTCFGLPASRLVPGVLAEVVGRSARKDIAPGGAWLKPDASRTSPVLRYLPQGAVVKIQENSQPLCTVDGDRWWAASYGDVRGYVTETVDQRYVLAPFSGPAPDLPAIDGLKLLTCIQPRLTAAPPTPTPAPDSPPVVRVVFADEEGAVAFSDNGGLPRVSARFNPPPLSVDLSPDGTAALVLTHNGLYWLDLLTGTTFLLADMTRFGNISEDVWLYRALWTPDGLNAAVELVDTRDNVYSFPIWNIGVAGFGAPFQVDSGTEPQNAVRRAPDDSRMIILGANAIVPYPSNFADETPALLEYVPPIGEGDARDIVVPSVTWTAGGFYTYVPASEDAPPGDTVGGHLWFIPNRGTPQDFGVVANVKPSETAIPSPDGTTLLVGRGESWRLQDVAGKVLQTLPPAAQVFGWTPDGRGVAFTSKEGKAGYLGVDGVTQSGFVPKEADNLFRISWLADGTILYVVRGSDEKLTFSTQRSGSDPVYIGILSNANAYSVRLFGAVPGLATPPQPCR